MSLFESRPAYVHNFSFLNSFPILLYKLLVWKVKIFYDCRDYFAWTKKRKAIINTLIRYIDIFIAKKICTQVIFPDENGFRYFNTRDKNKFHIIPNTVRDYYENSKTLARNVNENKKIKLFYSGYLSLDRNIETIINAVKNSSKLELHIASNYISSEFNSEILSSDNFKFHGKMTHREVLEFMRSCDYALIMYDPSLKNYQKILPTKFFDCICSNTPFICSKGMESLESFTNGEYPNLSLIYNDTNVFENLKKPLPNDENRKLYLEKYDYATIIDDLGNCYNSFLNKS
jgi:hypothetical protein